MLPTTAVKCAAVLDQGNPVWCLPSEPTAERDPQSCRSESLDLCISASAKKRCRLRRLNGLSGPWCAHSTAFYSSIVTNCTLFFLRVEFLYCQDVHTPHKGCPLLPSPLPCHITSVCPGSPTLRGLRAWAFQEFRKRPGLALCRSSMEVLRASQSTLPT